MLKEVESYLTDLNELREQVKNLLEGLPQEAMDWRPIEGEGELATNSMAAIVFHLAGSEIYWMKEIIAGKPIERDRDAEFFAKGLSPSQLKAKMDEAGKATQEALPPLTLGQLEGKRKDRRGREVTVRWAILHVLEHIANHLGHMQLTRQLWMVRPK